ncbi:MAG: hypothetical protein FWD03_01335 [Defluviitaleaceae bacterium]|nr:hypothetical protein [Defluviitaleaceae bacterium]
MGTINRSLTLGNRERMIRTCLNQDIDRQPFWSMFPPWRETVERWRSEGLPSDDWSAPFGFDVGFETLPVNLGFCPSFERQVLEEDNERRTIKDEYGITFVEKKGHSTIPMYIDYPVKTIEDWEMLKTQRLNPHSAERFPTDWLTVIADMQKRDAAVQVGTYPYGLFGTARDLMGVENLLMGFYEVPELIHDIMDYLTDFWIAIYKQILCDVQIDHIHIWEDMSGKHGPLISPDMFREFMMPNYKKIVDFARGNGISVVSVDTDGNMDIMMPLLEESGINLVLPFEVQAGCDIVAIKQQFPDICLLGGIDKRKLTFGYKEIDQELERIAEMFTISGYIPALDHLPHPEISFDNFTYFIKRLKEKID